MNSDRLHIGVDVGKKKLDVCYPNGKKETIENNKSSRKKLIKIAGEMQAIVSFESTGLYDEELAEECVQKGVKAIRLDAWKTRKFAESRGKLEKTDKLDSEVIRDFAVSLEEENLHFVEPQPPELKRLRKALRLREKLMRSKGILVNGLEEDLDSDLRKDLLSLIGSIERKIDKIETECEEAILHDEHMRALAERFLQAKGVGKILVFSVLAHCPNIAEFDAKSFAKFCGIAPLEYESCTIHRKAIPKRGREDLRRAFYMAAVPASRTNHVLKEVYQRLLAKGKPKKVALVAVARHLAMLLNRIARNPNFTPAQDPKDVAKANSAKKLRGRPRKSL